MNRLHGWLRAPMAAQMAQHTTVRMIRATGLALALLPAVAGRAVAAATYTITDLGTLGGKESQAYGINAAGQIVGKADLIGARDAFLYDGTHMRDLGNLGYGLSTARGINDLGQVVGDSLLPDTVTTHAFFIDGMGMHDIGTLPGSNGSSAWGVNAAGQVAGVDRGLGRAFLYSGGVMRDLGTLGGQQSEARAINDAGQVVGRANAANAYDHAFLYDSTGMHDLGLLPGGRWSLAFGINNAGQVVGYAERATGMNPAAFLYDSTGMHDLGTLPGSEYSSASAINDNGQIVGTCYGIGTSRHAFLWEAGQMRDLNDLVPAGSGWVIRDANAINASGQIAAVGIIGDDTTPSGAPERALLLSPVSVTPLTPPQAPTGPAVTFVAPQRLNVTWADNSNNESGFEVQRRRLHFWSDWATVGTVSPDSTSFTDNQVGAYIHYIYRVRAINAAGVSAWSDEASGDVGIGAIASLGWDSRDFGSVPLGGSSAPQSLTVTNAGTGPLEIQSVTLSGANPAEFSIAARPTTIAPGDTASIDLVFTPATLGSRSAELTIASNATNTLPTIELSGAGTPALVATLGLSAGSLSFGQQLVGTTSGAQPILLQNTGPLPVDISRVQIDTAGANDFTVTSDGATGTHLMPGHVCSVNVSFKPTATGSRAASLVITDSAQGSPRVVSLSGEGIAPQVSLSPGSLVFGDQLVGTTSEEQDVTLTNTGSAPLTIYGVSLAGPNAGDFQIAADISGFTLAPGLSGTVSLRFKPAAAGSRSATLAISDSAAGSPHVVTLAGSGTAPSITFGISRLNSPSAIAFGNQALGASSGTQTLTLTNSGTASLTISGISLAGANAGDYQIVADSGPASLVPGASRTLTVRFTPLALGNRPASLTIQDNAGGGTQTVGLTGAGVLPQVGTKGLILPSSAELIAVVDGVVAPSGKPVIVAVGQTVTLKLRVKFKDGAVADVTADPTSQYAATPKRGKFTGAGVWTAQAADAGRTTTLTGSWTLPKSRQRLVGAVTVTVKAVRKTRG